MNQIMELVRDFHYGAQLKRYATFEESADSWEDWFMSCMDRDDRLCLVVALPSIAGFLTAMESTAYWNPSVRFVTEATIWVNDDSRGKGWGNLLIERMCDWGEERGCHMAAAGSAQRMHPKAVGRMLQSHGFELEEKIYTRRIR